ncbi:hypothetical protein LIER_37956 [Lithospermum erythrorhizon]|uniref:Uncharacterized protein n=1 Tax=Lithospermum erythrorhizon TaxID=34254 RepID=A0AAV3PTY9_LITER
MQSGRWEGYYDDTIAPETTTSGLAASRDGPPWNPIVRNGSHMEKSLFPGESVSSTKLRPLEVLDLVMCT